MLTCEGWNQPDAPAGGDLVMACAEGWNQPDSPAGGDLGMAFADL